MEITNIQVPRNVTFLGAEVFNDNLLPDDKAFIYARNSDGSDNSTKIVSYGGANRGTVTIPEGVKTLGESSFYENYITNINLPSSLETIEFRTFYRNSFTSVVLPENLINIDAEAFRENSITSIIIPSSVNRMGNYIFYANPNIQITVNKPANSISGAPWGGANVIWAG